METVFTFFAMFCSVQIETVAAAKPNVLSPLVLLPLTGDEPRKGVACRIASEIVFEEVNSRRDILPNYHIIAAYRDEGAGSLQSVKQLAAYRRSHVEQTSVSSNESHVHPSPLMMGPFFSGGCKAVANHIQHYDMVTLSEGCSAPVPPADRRLFPNLYRSRITGELVAYPKLHFIREIAGWQRFGILTNAGNLFDYTLASFLLKEAERNGFQVSFFDCVPDIDGHTMTMLKDSDTRVIAVDFTIPSLILKFLCQTYRFGMTEGRYSFILFYGSYFEPSAMPDFVAGCTKEEIYQQLHYTFWVAWSSFAANPTIRSSLGHTLEEFETKFNQMTINLPKPADYDKRVLCYDATLAFATALDTAEKKLAIMNMSLSDYRQRPNEVMRVVNSSMAHVTFNGLRIGRFQYSASKAELDYDSFVAVQWTPQFGRVVLAWFDLSENVTSVYNYSSYSTKILQQLIWFTKDGKSPRDRRRFVQSLQHVPQVFFYSVIAIAGLIIIALLVIPAKCLISYKESFSHGVVFLILGCLLFAAGAMTTAFPMQSSSSKDQAVCILQRLLIALGFGFVQAGIMPPLLYHHVNYNRRKKTPFGMALQLNTFAGGNPIRTTAHQARCASSVTTQRGSLAFNGSTLQELGAEHMKKFCQTGVLLFGFFTGGYLFVWLMPSAPIPVRTAANDGRYDLETDIYSESELYVCTSANDDIWIVVILAMHAVALAIDVFLAYELRNCKSFGNLPEAIETAATLKNAQYLAVFRLTAFNIATLFLGGILIVVALGSPVDKMIALSVFMLLLSGISGVIVLFKGGFVFATA